MNKYQEWSKTHSYSHSNSWASDNVVKCIVTCCTLVFSNNTFQNEKSASEFESYLGAQPNHSVCKPQR